MQIFNCLTAWWHDWMHHYLTCRSVSMHTSPRHQQQQPAQSDRPADTWSFICQIFVHFSVFGSPLGSKFTWYQMHWPTGSACLKKKAFHSVRIAMAMHSFHASSALLRFYFKVAAVMERWGGQSAELGFTSVKNKTLHFIISNETIQICAILAAVLLHERLWE